MSWDEIDKISDEGLELLERKLFKLYNDAAKSMSGTIRRYFQQFVKRDAEMKGALDNGKITSQQYIDWRIAQIARGKRYEDLRDKLAERATKANETAVAYVNDTTPGVYTLNRNYAAYNIEKSYGNIGLTAWNEEAVRRLAIEEPDLMPYYPPQRAVNRGIDLAYGREQITAQIVSSILLGDGIPTIAEKLQQRIETMSRTSAIRTARTAYTAAQNGGRQATFEKAAEMGIKVRKRWVATKDLRTRYNHAAADGQVVDYDKPYIVGGEKLMFPGDGSMGASAGNLYNCRCAERTVEKEGIEAEPRMMRVRDPATGRNILVKEMTYAEWYKWKTGEDFTRNTLKNLAKPAKQSIIKIPDVQIGRSLGAKASNYDVLDLATGEKYYFVEGTHIQNIQVFAGKGTRTEYRNAYKYANVYGGNVEDWQHVKGNAWLNTDDGDRFAEVHWSQCENYGKHDFFIKRWLDV